MWFLHEVGWETNPHTARGPNGPREIALCKASTETLTFAEKLERMHVPTVRFFADLGTRTSDKTHDSFSDNLD